MILNSLMDLSIAQRPPHKPLVSSGEIDHHVADLSVTASADVTLSALQDRLAAHNQWLPIDGDPARTLGDLVAFNSTGPLRLGYGGWRDLLLGCQFTSRRGDLITAGGRAVKNVAGYDLTKLMVGQGNQLGRLVTLTTRTYRRPTAALLARFDRRRPDLLATLLPSPLRPQWSLLTPDALLCGYLGDERAIDYYLGELPRIEPLALERRAVADDVAHRARLWRWPPPAGAVRLAVPPATLDARLSGLSPRPTVADAAFGIVLVSDATPDDAKALNLRGVWSDGQDLRPLGLNDLEQEMTSRLKLTL